MSGQRIVIIETNRFSTGIAGRAAMDCKVVRSQDNVRPRGKTIAIRIGTSCVRGINLEITRGNNFAPS